MTSDFLFRFCDDSPAPELDWRLPKSKRPCATPVTEVLEGRRLRKCRRNANGCSVNSKLASRQSPVYNDANLGRRRGGKTLEPLESNCAGSQVQLDSSRRPGEGAAALDGGENLLECSGFNCRKKFKHVSGLSYHQSHAHGKFLLELSSKSSGAVEETALLSADDNSEIFPVVSSADGEITTENNEDLTAGNELVHNVVEEQLLFPLEVRDSVAANISETTVKLPAVASQTIKMSSEVSTLSADNNNASVETVEKAVFNLSQLSGDAIEDLKLIAGGTESCVRKQAICGNVSDDKEKDTMSPVSLSSGPEKVDFVEVSGDSLTPRHFSNSFDLRTLPLTSATRNSDSNAVGVVNHVVSLSESLAAEMPVNSTGSEGHSDEKNSAYSDISENNDDIENSKSAKLHSKNAKHQTHTNQNDTRHHPNKKPETSDSFYSSARSLHHSHGTSIIQNSTMQKKTESNSFLQQPEEKPGHRPGHTTVNIDTSRLREEGGIGQDFVNSRHTATAHGTKVSPVVASSVPYSHSQGYNNAYHMHFFAQHPESRNQYERWLMEHGHHYIHQQQRCFNKPMQIEADICSASQAEPVDMSSKGGHTTNTDRLDHPGLSSSRMLSSEQSMVNSADNRTPGKPTGRDWPPPTTHYRNLPPANDIIDFTGLGSSSSCSSTGISSLKESPRHDHQKHKDSTKLPCVNLGQGQRSLDHNVPSRPRNPIGATTPYSSDCKPPGYAKNFAHDPPPPRHASLIGGGYGSGGGVSYVEWPDCNSPNGSKLLDLDSKEVVSGCDHRHRSSGETRRATLDMLRCQDASHPGKDAPGWSQRESAAVDHASSLTLCHLHTHHHTHLVGAAYPIYGSYNGKCKPWICSCQGYF